MKRSLYWQLIVMAILACQSKKNIPESFPEFYIEGHRGARGLMPENTIAGMKKAIDEGANVIELDVFTSKDNQVIVTHDAYINTSFSLGPLGKELTNEDEKRYAVHQMSYNEITKFDVGLKGNFDYPEQVKVSANIPLLSELIVSIETYTTYNKLRKIIYNIELKTNEKFDGKLNSSPWELVDAVMKIVDQSSIGDRYYIQSFDIRPLRYIEEEYPEVVIGFLVANNKTFQNNLEILGFIPDIYSPRYDLVKPELVKKCKGICKLIPWTVNTKQEMQGLINLGVNGIITDYPNYLSRIDHSILK